MGLKYGLAVFPEMESWHDWPLRVAGEALKRSMEDSHTRKIMSEPTV